MLGVAVLLLSPLANAAPVVTKLAPGTGGPQRRDGGPGNEQAVVTHFDKNGERYLVSVYMSSNIPQEDRPWQLKCSSVKLNAGGPPSIIADQVQLTHLRGNRPASVN